MQEFQAIKKALLKELCISSSILAEPPYLKKAGWYAVIELILYRNS
jgi:hypothetical protein